MKLFSANNVETVKVSRSFFWYISSKRCFAQPDRQVRT